MVFEEKILGMYELHLYDSSWHRSEHNTAPVIRRLEYAIATLAAAGEHVLKVYHGTASDGRIRGAVRHALYRLRRERRIEFYIPGENFHSDDTATLYLTEKMPALLSDPDYAARNSAVTFVYF